MWKIYFIGGSLHTLDVYIEQYQEYFLRRFSDTGLWSEDAIRKNYENEAIILYDEIYDHILSSVSRDIIGYELREPTGDIRTTATFLGKRIIFIEYEEDQDKKIRYIQTIKIIYR